MWKECFPTSEPFLNWSATASATATAANAKRPGNMSHNPQLMHCFVWLQEIGSKQIEGENLLLVAQTKIHENKAGGVMKVMKIASLRSFSSISSKLLCQVHASATQEEGARLARLSEKLLREAGPWRMWPGF